MRRNMWVGRIGGRLRSALALLAPAALCLSLSAVHAQTPEPNPAQGPGLPMWVVRDADSTIYITGTVHLLRDGQQWRSPKLDAAFAEASELWLELAEIRDEETLRASLAPLMQKYAAYDGPPVSSLLSADENARLAKALAAAGAPPNAMEELDKLQPWVTVLTLARDHYTDGAYKAANGIDNALAAMAVARGIPVKGMETLESQIALSVDGNIESQLADLRAILFAPPGVRERGTRLADLAFGSWTRGETNLAEALVLFNRLSASYGFSNYDALFTDRNEAWAGVVQDMLKGSGTAFIAVGAGHLVGPESLQERLKLRGITAERF